MIIRMALLLLLILCVWGCPSSKTITPELIDDVNIVDFGKYVVSKSDIESAFESGMNVFSKDAKVVPKVEGLTIQGFKFATVRAGGIWDKVGLKSGDVVHQINSKKLSGPADALKSLEQIRNKRVIILLLTRNEQLGTITIMVKN